MCVNIHIYIHICLSLVAQTIKLLPAMRATWVQCLGWEDLLEKEIATHSYILAWKIPWTVKPGRLQSIWSQRVGHDWVTSLSFFHFTHLYIYTCVCVCVCVCVYIYIYVSHTHSSSEELPHKYLHLNLYLKE